MSEQVLSRTPAGRPRRALPWAAAVVVVGIVGAAVLAGQDRAVRHGPAEIVSQRAVVPLKVDAIPAVAAPFIDHSVVRSLSIADQPDMTGASIAEYGR